MPAFLLNLKGRSPTLLVVLGGLLVLAATAVSGLVVWNSYRQAQAAAGSGMERSARLLEQGLTSALESLDATLTRVAEPLARTDDLAAARRIIQDALRFAPHLRQIMIVDVDGWVILDTAHPQDRLRHDDRDRGAVVDPAAWGLGPEAPRSLGSALRIGTAVGGRYLVPSQSPADSGHWIIPVEVDHPVGGYRLIAALNPDFFLRAFAAVLSGPVEEAMLLRYDGHVLAAHGAADAARPSPAAAPGPWGWSVAPAIAAAIRDSVTARQSLSTPLTGTPGVVAVRLSEVYPVAVALAFTSDGLLTAWLDEEQAAVITLGLAPVLLGLLALAILALLRHRLRLRSELRVLSRVVEEAPVAVVVTDRNGHIEFVNDSFTRLLGYQPSEVLGHTPRLLKSGHSDQPAYDDLWTTILAGDVWHGEFLNRAKDGRLVWMAAAVSGVRDDDGRMRRFVAIENDVTERKRAEAAMTAMVDRLDTSNRELEQFARVASHDLQEPLRMVTGYLSLLQRRFSPHLPTEAQGFIANAVGGADRMRGLIKDLLAYSQVSNRQVTLVPIDADQALKRALDMLAEKITATGACIHADPLPMVMAEDRNLLNLFHSLVDNALTHRHPDRAPVIRITCEDALSVSHWSISVEDNGPGISPRDHDRVFRLFQHLHTTDTAQGNGVGLAVARRIVERAGGSIRVESDGSTGSQFIVLLPKVGGKTPVAGLPSAFSLSTSGQ